MIPYILYSEILHIFETPPSGQWKLSNEVVDWFNENDIIVTEERFKITSISSKSKEYGLLFRNEIDFMAFKLRWL